MGREIRDGELVDELEVVILGNVVEVESPFTFLNKTVKTKVDENPECQLLEFGDTLGSLGLSWAGHEELKGRMSENGGEEKLPPGEVDRHSVRLSGFTIRMQMLFGFDLKPHGNLNLAGLG